MHRWLISMLLLASSATWAVSDYAREKKWADEITPSIVVGEPVYIQQANRPRFLGVYTASSNVTMGVIVVHGIGLHPDWGMVSTLRQRLADGGYATLSIQMPILAADAKGSDYPPTFPEAAERLRLASNYLKGKGYRKLAIVSHSMGSRMSHSYMVRNPSDVAAWASLGITGGETYDGIKAPVLDLYGAKDLPQVLAGANKRRQSLAGNPASVQVEVPDADHFFADQEDAMVAAVQAFLDKIGQSHPLIYSHESWVGLPRCTRPAPDSVYARRIPQ